MMAASYRHNSSVRTFFLQFEADKTDLKQQHRQELEEKLQDAAETAGENLREAKTLADNEMENQLRLVREEHTDELKNLHSQHHKKVSRKVYFVAWNFPPMMLFFC